jgi:hypothetical protein
MRHAKCVVGLWGVLAAGLAQAAPLEEDPFKLSGSAYPDVSKQIPRRAAPIKPPEVREASQRVDYHQKQLDRMFKEVREGREGQEKELSGELEQAYLQEIARRQQEIEEEYAVVIMRAEKTLAGREENEASGGGGGGKPSKGAQTTGGKPGDPAADAYNDRQGASYTKFGEEIDSATGRWGWLRPKQRDEVRIERREEIPAAWSEWYRRYNEAVDKAVREQGK